ncbi:MAG: D-aminoacyl-tRNA deacylase [Verrucomicrobiota bacterium]
MRAVIQRVSEASVSIGGEEHGSIAHGFVILLGIEESDEEDDALWLAGKVAKMRVFADEEGHMNLSLGEVDGRVLVVSQFTLHAATKKGNRPSFIRAARPEKAIPLYERFIVLLGAETGNKVETGQFGADMQVSLVNDGPVTIWMDSKARE